MLLQKTKFTENDIISFKLISGEEIIGKYVSEDMVDIIIHYPIMLAMTQKGPAMAPLMMTVDPDKDFNIPKSVISFKGITNKEIADQYILQTTGIQPVTTGNIIR